MSKPTRESIAKALIITSKNEVLTLTIGEHKAIPTKSHRPDLPGGIVDPGETERDAVIREIREETGLVVDQRDAELVFARTEFFASENKSVSKHLFVVRLEAKPSVTLSWEHEAYRWIPVESLSAISFGSFHDRAIKYCLENNIL